MIIVGDNVGVNGCEESKEDTGEKGNGDEEEGVRKSAGESVGESVGREVGKDVGVYVGDAVGERLFPLPKATKI